MGKARLFLTLGLLSASTAAQAITLSFDPASSEVSVGSSVSVNLVVSDLADSAAPSLGTYDLDVLFDPARFSLAGVAFGDPVLGDQLDLFDAGSLSGYDDSVPGTLNVFEISFDLPADLDDLQAGSFTLFTLTFDALAEGTSSLDIESLILGDALGDPLTSAVVPGSITATALPEPAAATLVALGSLLLVLGRLRTS